MYKSLNKLLSVLTFVDFSFLSPYADEKRILAEFADGKLFYNTRAVRHSQLASSKNLVGSLRSAK